MFFLVTDGNIFFSVENDTFLPIFDDTHSNAIVFPFGIPFFGQIETVAYVSLHCKKVPPSCVYPYGTQTVVINLCFSIGHDFFHFI